MQVRSRIIGSVAAVTLASGGLTAATVTTAGAVAQSCYGSAKSYNTNGSYLNQDWPVTGYATTTSNCSDINVKPNQTIQVMTCFYTTGCNKYRTIQAGTWGVAATDVYNGSKFYLHFWTPSSGQVAY